MSSQSLASWAFPGHPAYEYLFGQPEPPCHEELFFGAFPTDPPNTDQAIALKHQRQNSLTAVIGPPGNGKTTLLLHEIALSVVERGYQLASTGFDESNLTFVTSTNNRAVNNVLERLATLFSADCFYLVGGRKELIDNSLRVLLLERICLEAHWSQVKEIRKKSIELKNCVKLRENKQLKDFISL
ncbi:MAG: AAA family ATPase [Pleurocapsa sp. SU_5_0]|nr:AAA family ATPase [Pleurocapsa sp. SU_5_0]